MGNDQQFCVRIWSLVAVVAIITFSLSVLSSAYYKYLTAQAPDPMAYACALDAPGQYTNPTCVIYWQQKGVK